MNKQVTEEQNEMASKQRKTSNSEKCKSNEMPFSSIRQENLEREHLLGGKGILPIKMGTVIAVWKRNLTASIKSKNIHSPHLSNPTIGNLISIDINTTMGRKNKGI